MGSRLERREKGAFMYRNFYANKMLGWLYRRLTDSEIRDFLTGYRAISNDLAEKLELNSEGFEIETEITFKTLKLRENVKEVEIKYRG
ncbi:family 2 glycosyl transferase [Candidatus Haloredivivus sp. G17]|nr:family 2 glycosyl transferase [Candidatus Haloredivivus sp. G17]